MGSKLLFWERIKSDFWNSHTELTLPAISFILITDVHEFRRLRIFENPFAICFHTLALAYIFAADWIFVLTNMFSILMHCNMAAMWLESKRKR